MYIEEIMSFAFDKPMIVRIIEPITALLGVYFLYIFVLNYQTELLPSLAFLAMGVLAIADGFILHMRRSYAWSLNLAVLAIICVAGIVMSIQGSSYGIVITLLAALLIVSWSMRFTRDYFLKAPEASAAREPESDGSRFKRKN